MVCVEIELAGLIVAALEGKMFNGLDVGCFGWISFAGLGFPICCIAACVAKAAAKVKAIY